MGAPSGPHGPRLGGPIGQGTLVAHPHPLVKLMNNLLQTRSNHYLNLFESGIESGIVLHAESKIEIEPK